MIQFLKNTKITLTISGLLIVVGLMSIFIYGFNYSIDFVGGAAAEFVMGPKNEQKVRDHVNKQYPSATIQKSGDSLLIKEKNLTKEGAQKIANQTQGVRLGSFETISPSVSTENISKTITAFAVAAVGILLYVAYSFSGFRYALAAVIAMFHDTVLLMGAWSLFGRFFGAQFDILFVTALLIIMSFSVHDTIIIFDKLKEEESAGRYGSLEEKINAALTLTIVRSTNTSITTILVLASLVILGGSATRWFSISLLIGMLFGTYSSPFIAAPMYYFLTRFFKKRT
ncbi:MAG: protein translocase subunit SecF [Candidatus Roizmanbacteria bacterium]|nr:protein translocase subunit SecF [Candidatus Roizmanbacteria bacterium]